MKQTQENHEPEVIDPQVAAQYGLIADESTPPELDRAVMHNARQAVRTDDRRGPFAAWLRPAAFVATAGLSLAIVINLSNTRVFEPLTVTPPEIRQPVAAQPNAETAADIAPRKRTAADAADALRREKSTLTPLSKMTAPVAAENANGLSLQSPTRNLRATAELAMEAIEQCREAMTSTVDDWWNCITKLRQAGMPERADSELESLTRKYPDFKQPEPNQATETAGTRPAVPE